MTTTAKQVASIATKDGVSVYYDGQSYVINREHPNFKAVVAALKAKEYDKLDGLLDVVKAVETYMSPDPDFGFVDGLVVLNGEPFDTGVSSKVMRMMSEGFDVQPVLNFLRKVRKNPSNSAQRELLLFCEANAFAITEDGNLLAYKSVREDYTDMHSGKFNNSVGEVVSMPRHLVDDRREVTCSHGLHFAAYEYAKGFGAGARHIMILSIDPEDVVSIPSDYNNQKGRCCKYTVIGERKDFTPLPAREVYTEWDYTRDGEADDLRGWDEDKEDEREHEDAGKSIEQLKAEYNEHPDFTRNDWRDDEDTDLGYWDWVVEQIANY